MKNKFKLFFKERILGEQVREVDKEKSMITLMIWVVVILILFAFLRVNYQRNLENKQNQKETTKEEVKKTNNLQKPFSNLKDSYNYKIVITNELNEVVESYEGIYNKNVNIGKKVVNEDIINYKIESGTVINSNTNEVITDLYGLSLSYFFVPNNVYEYVKDLEYQEIKDDNMLIYTYNSMYEDISIDFKITLEEDNIKEIDYTYNNFKYNIILS